MNTFKGSQIAQVMVIAAFLIITPSLSTSSRRAYLYFVLNLLLIALGAQAGLLSFIFKPAQPQPRNYQHAFHSEAASGSSTQATARNDDDKQEAHHQVMIEKYSSKKKKKIGRNSFSNNCPSTPSLFSIGGGDGDYHHQGASSDQEVVSLQDDEDEEELFHKAETFIGNFYKQLKMQREESRQKLLQEQL